MKKPVDYVRDTRAKNAITHGMSYTKAYDVWVSMKSRCLNKKDKSYKNYGGRGIKICDRWLSFQNFYEDMGEPPKGKTLDRIDNDGDYFPPNCRWATRAQQNRNHRRNVVITWKGKTQTLADWSKETGIKYFTLRGRLKKGWVLPDLFKPVKWIEN